MRTSYFKAVLATMIIFLIGGALNATPAQAKSIEKTKALEIPTLRNTERTAPDWTFSIQPTDMLMSYSDYMIGGYNSLPLSAVPQEQGGGYFLNYQGKRSTTGFRRVFSCFLDNTGLLYYNNEITGVLRTEGFSSMVFDPVSGKPFYAWQANADNNTDALLEIQLAYDAYFEQTPGIISDQFTVINNPIAISSTTDNEFIYPIVQVGPSPTAGMRRVYVLGKNNTTHSGGSCENPYIAYADVNAAMLENEVQPFSWNYLSIPLMNQWNNDTAVWRQPFYSFCVGNDGKLYVVGYHSNDLLNVPANTPDLDVFVCDNYGQGAWQYYNYSSHIPAYNPHRNNGSGPGFFVDGNGNPFTDDQIFMKITNSSHLNAVVDVNNVVHMIGLWGLGYQTGNLTSEINTIKEMTFNADTHAFGIREIYPQAGMPNDDFYWLPWDADGDGTTDSYDTIGNPVISYDWNYPYWDETAHENSMIARYNNLKITRPNAFGGMAAVWQNSGRARQYRLYQNNQYADYNNVPEIYVSVSANFGHTWSEPIIINSVETAQFGGNCPMWVYPADTVKYMGANYCKLGLMYYSDNDWGAYDLPNPVGTNNGGTVKFMELAIEFDWGPSVNGVSGYVRRADTNQTIPEAVVSIGGQQVTTNAAGHYLINLYPGTYNGFVYADGFDFQELSNVTVTEDNFTVLNIYLVLTPTVEVSGIVVSGNPPVPLGNAIVTIEDEVDHIGITNAQGIFNLSGIGFNHTYEYVISYPGFYSVTGSINVTDVNYNLGTISMVEFPYAPNNPVATVSDDNNSVDIGWEAPNPPGTRNLTGYKVWRLIGQDSGSPAQWILLTTIPVIALQYIDTSWTSLPSNTYRYAVKAVYSGDAESEVVLTNPVEKVVSIQDNNNAPNSTRISGIYPNPFTDKTQIEFEVKVSTRVKLDIFNLHGQLIYTLTDAQKAAGRYRIGWNGKDKQNKQLPSGIYLCKMSSDKATSTMKLIILR